MDFVSPLGKVYQAGTLSGNPLAMAAGLQTIERLKQPGTYKKLHEKTKALCEKLQKGIQKSKKPVTLNWATGMFTLFFTKGPVTHFQTANRSDTKIFSDYFHTMLKQGIYLPPSQFEANFISLSHSKADLDFIATTINRYLAK